MAVSTQELPPIKNQPFIESSKNSSVVQSEIVFSRRKFFSEGASWIVGGIGAGAIGAILIDNSQDQIPPLQQDIKNTTPAFSPTIEAFRDRQASKLNEAKKINQNARLLVAGGLLGLLYGTDRRRKELEIRDNKALADQLKPTEIT